MPPQDYVEGMWLMLQQDQPDDFVLATGHMHSVRYQADIPSSFVNANEDQNMTDICVTSHDDPVHPGSLWRPLVCT